MVGNVGDDGFGRDYFEALGKEGINAAGVTTVKGETTGAANIIVEEETGENRIMFTPGANNSYAEKEEEGGWNLVPEDAGVVVFQLEIPMRVVSSLITLLHLQQNVLWCLTLTRSSTTFTSPANKANTPCSTRRPLFPSPRPRSKTSTR